MRAGLRAGEVPLRVLRQAGRGVWRVASAGLSERSAVALGPSPRSRPAGKRQRRRAPGGGRPLRLALLSPRIKELTPTQRASGSQRSSLLAGATSSSSRVHTELYAKSARVGRKRVARHMRAGGLTVPA